MRSTDPVPIASSVSAPTTQQGWRKHRNETYGYSIRYPETWVVSESYSTAAVVGVPVYYALDLGRASAGGYADGGPAVLLRVMAVKGSTATIAEAFISASAGVIADGPIEADGVVGERWSAVEGRGGWGAFFIHNGRRYVLVVERVTGQRGATIGQVAESFKFE